MAAAADNSAKCHYAILGVELTAGATELKNAYRRLALKVRKHRFFCVCGGGLMVTSPKIETDLPRTCADLRC